MTISQSVRDSVAARASNRCEYCRLHRLDDVSPQHIEHIRPRKHGGSDDPSNLALACFHCNRHKGSDLAGIDRETGKLISLSNPRAQTWSEHFLAKGVSILGLTPTGRVTATVLKINDGKRLELRATALHGID